MEEAGTTAAQGRICDSHEWLIDNSPSLTRWFIPAEESGPVENSTIHWYQASNIMCVFLNHVYMT